MKPPQKYQQSQSLPQGYIHNALKSSGSTAINQRNNRSPARNRTNQNPYQNGGPIDRNNNHYLLGDGGYGIDNARIFDNVQSAQMNQRNSASISKKNQPKLSTIAKPIPHKPSSLQNNGQSATKSPPHGTSSAAAIKNNSRNLTLTWPWILSIAVGLFALGFTGIVGPLILMEANSIWSDIDGNMDNFRHMQDKIWYEMMQLSDEESKRFRRQFSYLFPDIAKTDDLYDRELGDNFDSEFDYNEAEQVEEEEKEEEEEYPDYRGGSQENNVHRDIPNTIRFGSNNQIPRIPSPPRSNAYDAHSLPAQPPGLLPRTGGLTASQLAKQQERYQYAIKQSESLTQLPSGVSLVGNGFVSLGEEALAGRSALDIVSQAFPGSAPSDSIPSIQRGSGAKPPAIGLLPPKQLSIPAPPNSSKSRGIKPPAISLKTSENERAPVIRTVQQFPIPPIVVARSPSPFTPVVGLPLPVALPQPAPPLAAIPPILSAPAPPIAVAGGIHSLSPAPPNLAYVQSVLPPVQLGADPGAYAFGLTNSRAALSGQGIRVGGGSARAELNLLNQYNAQRAAAASASQFQAAAAAIARGNRIQGGIQNQVAQRRLQAVQAKLSRRRQFNATNSGGSSFRGGASSATFGLRRGRVRGGSNNRRQLLKGRISTSNSITRNSNTRIQTGGGGFRVRAPGFVARPPAGQLPPAPPPGNSRRLGGGPGPGNTRLAVPKLTQGRRTELKPPGTRLNVKVPSFQPPGSPRSTSSSSANNNNRRRQNGGSPDNDLRPPGNSIPVYAPPRPPGSPSSLLSVGQPGLNKINQRLRGPPGSKLRTGEPRRTSSKSSRERTPNKSNKGLPASPATIKALSSGLRPGERLKASQLPGAYDHLLPPGSRRQTIELTALPKNNLPPKIISQLKNRLGPEIAEKLSSEFTKFQIQGTRFGSCSNCRGPSARCPRGPPGEPGYRGEDGEPGDYGRDGRIGKRGRSIRPSFEYSFSGGVLIPNESGRQKCYECIRGPPGQKGQRGRRGKSGSAGWSGPQGSPGAHGPFGTKGPKGHRGKTGKPGRIGREGDDGPPVYQIKGQRGPSGPTGEAGGYGLKGRNGQEGLRGTPGGQGEYGKMGRKGLPGGRGNRGKRGIKGPREYCPCPPRKPLILGLLQNQQDRQRSRSGGK